LPPAQNESSIYQPARSPADRGFQIYFPVQAKHIFNPSAFGITATLLITGDAWLFSRTMGQWCTPFFPVLTLGTIVVTRVQKLDTSLSFLLTFGGLLYWRQVVTLGWPGDYFGIPSAAAACCFSVFS